MHSLPAGILEYGPEDMARLSLPVKEAQTFLSGQIAGITDAAVREKLLLMVERPRLFLAKQQQKELFRQLKEQALLDAGLPFHEFAPEPSCPTSVWTASGSHYRGHNAHPGGLAVHTEKNLRLSLAAGKTYETTYGLPVDWDILIFAQAAHDLAKTWLLPWQENGSCPAQYHIAGGGAHHAFGLAESIRRGIPPRFVFAQAATHADPSTEEGYSHICGFISAACFIAGADPISYGFWDKRGKPEFDRTSREFWFSYMADHAVISTIRVTRRAVKILKKIAVEEYGFHQQALDEKPFNQFRNYIFCQFGTAAIFRLLSAGGADLLTKEVHNHLARTADKI